MGSRKRDGGKMGNPPYLMSKQQAHQFANAIFSDISKYVDEHQAEYAEFLSAEQKREEKGGKQCGNKSDD